MRLYIGLVQERHGSIGKSRRHAGTITSDKRLATREGKVLIDYSQNAMGKSIVAPYSVRAKPEATVSTPLRWEEVRERRVRPSDFTMRTVRDRLEKADDLFAAILDLAHSSF